MARRSFGQSRDSWSRDTRSDESKVWGNSSNPDAVARPSFVCGVDEPGRRGMTAW